MTHKDFILLTCYVLAFNCVTGLKRDKSNGLRRPFFNHPQCPRQKEMIAEGRTCLKKCLTDADCRGSRRQCLCDGACGNGCVRIAMKCKHLDELKHGSFEIHPRNAFGSVVRYSCDEGYILSGKKERTCQGDGRWSGDAPTCETEGNCRDPPMVENSIYNRTTDPAQSRSSTPLTAGPEVVYPLGTQLVYRCLDGFEAIGFHKSMCVGEGRWVGPKMSCSPKRCGHPGEIPNGRREDGAFVYESRVNYTCRSGYELVGRSYRVCQANGVWSGSLPVCLPTKCPRPAPLDNGVIAGTDFSFGSVIRYSCSRGYLLTGEAKRSCQHDKTWSGRDPVCTIVRCPDLDQIANGYSRNTIETTYNSTVYFYCVGKSQSYGESMFTTCKEDGRWSNPVPKCLNKCEIPSVEYGNISKPFSEGDFVDHRERLPLECDDGFVVEMDTRCNNGSWNGSTKCVPSRKPCSSSRPPELKDGSFRFHSTDHGEYAQYTCEAGYQLEGDDKRVCRNGEWEALNQEPSCTAKNCTYPGKLLHGDILLVGVRGKFIYREYVRKIGHNEKVEYRCSKEYSLEGPDGATCVDGKWSPERKPNCTLNSYMLIEKFKSLRERRAV